MFFPQTIKYDLWNMALEMNPQLATYKVRTSTATPGGSDSFTTFNLLRVVYRELNDDEIVALGGIVADVWKVWCITQVDLDQSGAPIPQLSYELVINGQTWLIENVKNTAMNQAFECLCRLSR